MAKFFILFLIFSGAQCVAQKDSMSYRWSNTGIYQLEKSAVWEVDGLENVYTSGDGQISKYDSVGVLKFSQSIKSLGRTSAIVPVNTMKLVHFSEDQQTLCYFDNTLSSLEDCLDLSEEDLIAAALISRSNQPDKVWLFDKVNSSLLLLSTSGKAQQQKIPNLNGTIDTDNIIQLAERSNRLFLLDQLKGIFIFDLYGSLLDFIKMENVLAVDAYEESMFVLQEEQLLIYDLSTKEHLQIDLPVKDVIDFRYRNRYFFFRTAKSVHKFALQF